MTRYVVGDVHGEFHALKLLLKALDLGKNDQVYFLGDLINRGPQSKEVVNLVRTTPNFYAVMGNHECLIIDAVNRGGKALELWLGNKGIPTLSSYSPEGKFTEQLLDDVRWMESLPLYLDLGNFFLVHAGLQYGISLENQNPKDFLWIRDDFYSVGQSYFLNKIIVVGHTVTDHLGKRRNPPGSIIEGPGWIAIDTGAHSLGYLSALNLETLDVIQVLPTDKIRTIPPAEFVKY